MKIRYADYDESLRMKNFLVPEDKVNVFISVESILNHFSKIPDLENKIILERDFETIIVSNLINLIAHYKRFFTSNGLDTRVYLYMTAIDSLRFSQSKYNDDYRSYYLVKWNENPKFVQLSDLLKKSILPTVKTYIEFIPGAYFIDAKDIEGSLVPLIIANSEPERKNMIITADVYDMQYSFIKNFVTHYLYRGWKTSFNASTVSDYLRLILRKDAKDIDDEMKKIFVRYPFFISLISVLGNKPRSIDPIAGIKTSSLFKLITDGIAKQTINDDSESPILLSEIFQSNEERKEEFVHNFCCSSLKIGYDELTKTDIKSILNQRMDRIDINSLVELNRTVFSKYPLILEGLL